MTWLQILEAECKRSSKAEVARQLGLSRTTVSLVLAGKYQAGTTHIERLVREKFGSREDWLPALRAEVERTNQTRAATKIGVSEATVSQVLSGNYKASTLRIERRVRGALLGETCDCPVLYSPPLHVCQMVQERKQGQFGNPHYAQAWLACRGLGRDEAAGPCRHFNGAGSAPREAKENES